MRFAGSRDVPSVYCSRIISDVVITKSGALEQWSAEVESDQIRAMFSFGVACHRKRTWCSCEDHSHSTREKPGMVGCKGYRIEADMQQPGLGDPDREPEFTVLLVVACFFGLMLGIYVSSSVFAA
jgi:hypothetical protein